MTSIDVETAWNIITENEESSYSVHKDGITYYSIAFKTADYPELGLTEPYGMFSGDSTMLQIDAYNAGKTFEEAVYTACDAHAYQHEALFC